MERVRIEHGAELVIAEWELLGVGDVEHPIISGEIERGKRLALNRIAPPRGETRFITAGPAVEPSAG